MIVRHRLCQAVTFWNRLCCHTTLIISRNGSTVAPSATSSSIPPHTDIPSPWTPDQLSSARNLLRAILRECTYLPDPHARRYIASHSLERFRAYTLPSKPLHIIQDRWDTQMKNARKGFSELRRANAGQLKVLTKVLHMTYGRIGKRRYELLEPLLRPDAVTDDTSSLDPHKMTKTVSSLDQQSPAEPASPRLPALTEKLKALILSQIRFSPPTTTRPNPRSLSAKIPQTNMWELPMPQKRIKNATRKWYATVLSRAMPPLTTKDWEELRARAMGELDYPGPVARRTRASVPVFDKAGKGDERWKDVLEEEIGIKKPNQVDRLVKKVDDKRRVLAKRFMQRRWAAVFAQCACMDWDEKSEKWTVRWGVTVLDDSCKLAATVEDGSRDTGVLSASSKDRCVSKPGN